MVIPPSLERHFVVLVSSLSVARASPSCQELTLHLVSRHYRLLLPRPPGVIEARAALTCLPHKLRLSRSFVRGLSFCT